MSILAVLDHYDLLTKAYVSDSSIKIVCPFHNDQQASLSANIKTGTFYCFGCGKAGTPQSFIQEYEGVDGIHSLRKLQQIRVGANKAITDIEHLVTESTRPDHREQLQSAYGFFITLSKPSWNVITNHYMLKRGFKPETLKHFDVRINGSSTYPVILPLIEQQRFLGYITRRTDKEEPKYLYSAGYPRRSGLIGQIHHGPVLVVEGVFDLMKAWQHGFKNTVALCGWKCTEFQLKKLTKYASLVICATDNDEAGVKGYKDLQKKLPDVVRFQFPDHIKDVGEMSKREFREALWQTYANTNV